MAGTLTVDRRRWLGYRWHRHGLGASLPPRGLDDLLLLGVQASRHGAAEQSLRQRGVVVGRAVDGSGATAVPDFIDADAIGPDAIGPDDIGPDGPLVVMWSVRGAPHVHRVGHLDAVRDALAPTDDEGGLEEVEQVAAALRAVVTAATPKGTASAAVAARLPGELVTWCERCGSHHVPDGLFRAAGRQARLVLGPLHDRTTLLLPPPAAPQLVLPHPRLELLRAFVRLNGPTSRTAFRDWMHGGAQATAQVWRQLGPLLRVVVDGRRLELPETLLDELQAAPSPQGVVLVPAHDPYLRQVDRTLLVPDGARRGQVWRALSPPGALLVDGEVAGTWRYRRGDGELTVTPFDPVAPARRAEARAAAAAVADAVGGPPPRVRWT